MKPKESKKRCVQFTFRAFAGTREADVIGWLNQTPSRSLARERANQALCSAWLPFVYLDEGSRSREELQQIAQEMNHRMVNQILYVCQMFGIEPPRILGGQSNHSQPIGDLQSLINTLQSDKNIPEGYFPETVTGSFNGPTDKPNISRPNTSASLLEDLDLGVPDNMLADVNG